MSKGEIMLKRLKSKSGEIITIALLSVALLAVVQFVRTVADGTLKEQGKKIACAHRGDCK